MLKNLLLLWLAAIAVLFPTRASAAAGYSFVEGYNVLDTNNASIFTSGVPGTNFAATAGQERDIAVDAERGIIYMARGQNSINDRPGGVIGIAAIVVTNGARAGSNFRDTGLIVAAGGQTALSWCQSLAYDKGSDKLWLLGGPISAVPNIYSAPGGTLGGAPNGDGIAAQNAALTKAFQLDTNLLDVGVYVPGVNGPAGRGGSPRGFAVRTAGGVTTVYLGMGNHVQAWSNDQPLTATNSPWRRIWATLRPPAGNLVSTRVSTSFSGVNGLAVDDAGNCYFSVQTTGGRIWTVRPSIIGSVADPMSLEYNDLAFGGSNEREILSLIYSSSTLLVTPPQSLTFCRFDDQRSLFVSFLPGTATRGVTRIDVADNFSFTNGGAYMAATAVDGFGSGQPAGGQDTILATLRLKATNAAPAVTQPFGASNGTLYHDVDSITNPTFIYVEGFVIDTNKGQTIATAGIIKVRIPSDTNPPSITIPPQAQTLLEGGTIALSVGASGLRPLHFQWQSNSVDIPGATNQTLTITPASTNDSGLYDVVITNALDSITSVPVQVTVNPLVRSTAMTPLWSIAPGSRYYLPPDNSQRGLTYNPSSADVLVVSRSPSNSIHVLNSEDGSDLFQLRVDPGIVTGGTYSINMIGASDDGNVYAANLAVNGETFRIYRWETEDSSTIPQLAYSGIPYAANRWGDTLDVRGSGNDIQILAGTRNSNVVAILTTADGGAHFTSTAISVPTAPNGAFGLGVAFAGSDMFWGKGDGGTGLRLVQFDLAHGTGAVLRTYGVGSYAASAIPIAVETNLNLLASISIENPDNLRLYDLSDLEAGPRLVDQELFAADNDNTLATGAIDFGVGKVFALDSNNGIIALTLGSIPPAPPGRIAISRGAGGVTLEWLNNFVLQSATNVAGPYTDLTAPTNSYSESMTSEPQKFFKLRN